MDATNGTTEDLGGLSIPPVGGANPGTDSPSGTASASAETIRQRKQRSDTGKPRGPRGGNSAASLPPISQAQFAALYDPKIWGRALGAPADAMAAISGKKHWELSQQERDNLGATGAIAAQCYAVSDPRALALALALITVLDTYGIRLAKDWADARATKAAEEKKKKDLYTAGQQ